MKIINRSAKYTLLICLFVSFSHVGASDIIVSTGELPPYSYTEGKNRVGVATDVVKEIMRRVGHSRKITSLPWARAIKMSHKNNRITYPLARLPFRENKYLWIGPILKDSFVFCVRKADKMNGSKISDFKHFPVGVNNGAPTHARLQKLEFTNLQAAWTEETNIRMLLKKRIDAWYSTRLMIRHILRNSGIEDDKVRIAFSDMDIEMYIVASSDLKNAASKWQRALDEMKSDGTYRMILKNNGINLLYQEKKK